MLRIISMVYSLGGGCTCSGGVLSAEHLSLGSKSRTAFCTTIGRFGIIAIGLQVLCFTRGDKTQLGNGSKWVRVKTDKLVTDGSGPSTIFVSFFIL